MDKPATVDDFVSERGPLYPSRLGEPDVVQTPNFEVETLTVTPEGIRIMIEQSAMTAQVTTESRPTYRQLVTEEVAKRLLDFGPREACWILTDALRLAGKGAESTDQFRADDFRRLADHVWEMQQRVSNRDRPFSGRSRSPGNGLVLLASGLLVPLCRSRLRSRPCLGRRPGHVPQQALEVLRPKSLECPHCHPDILSGVNLGNTLLLPTGRKACRQKGFTTAGVRSPRLFTANAYRGPVRSSLAYPCKGR